MIKFTNEDIEILDTAIDRWGNDAQLMMAAEEMSHLTKEIAKYFRNRNNHAEIKEEAADVLITVMQVAKMFNVDDVQAFKDNKMKRLKERVTR